MNSNQPIIKRVHEKKSNGKYYQLPLGQDAQGNQYDVPITEHGSISPSRILKAGFPVINHENIEIMNTDKSGLPYAVKTQEDVLGAPGYSRLEMPKVGGQRTVLRVTITNGEATDEEILVGDAYGLIASKLGVGAIKAGVVVGGTWGTATLTVLTAITAANPYRLHDIQFQGYTAAGADSNDFYNSGYFRLAQADIANRTCKDEELVLTDLVKQDSYNTNIRSDKTHRFIMDGFSGYHLLVPAGESIQINVEVSAVAMSYAMDRVATL